MRILVVSDAWAPQVNGVVRTLEAVTTALRAGGDTVRVVGPDLFRSAPAPGEPALRLALWPGRRLRAILDGFAPDAVHLATEGPLGWSARRLLRARGWRFTTSFHTRFPDYLRARAGVPEAWSWAALRRFHAPAAAVMAATGSLERELAARGFGRVRRWSRGVDAERFRPGLPDAFPGLPRPVFLCAGRVAVEKNIEAFLALDLPGTKVVVGDGPALPALRQRHPGAVFLGYRGNGALAACYASADVLVFPSRTDTFGLVLLEAMACGTPVAAFPVPGPLDVAGPSPGGALDRDLKAACLRALALDRTACRRYAEGFSWEACAARFRALLVPAVPPPGPDPAPAPSRPASPLPAREDDRERSGSVPSSFGRVTAAPPDARDARASSARTGPRRPRTGGDRG